MAASSVGLADVICSYFGGYGDFHSLYTHLEQAIYNICMHSTKNFGSLLEDFLFYGIVQYIPLLLNQDV